MDMLALPTAPRVRVKVSDETIEGSKKRNSSHCMTAEGVRASFPGATHVSVDIQTIRFTDKAAGARYTYLTPRAVQVAIIRFDQGEEVKGFSFTLSNGQVTSYGSRQQRVGDPEGEERRQIAKAAKAKAKRTATASATTGTLSKPKTVGAVPAKVGGKTPPLTSVGRTRSFGLRGLVA
jgi:hypothetical protein